MKSKFLFLLDLKWFLWIQHISKTSVKIPFLCSICKTFTIPINKKYIIIFPRKRPNLGCRDDFCKVKHKKMVMTFKAHWKTERHTHGNLTTALRPCKAQVELWSDWEWKEGDIGEQRTQGWCFCAGSQLRKLKESIIDHWWVMEGMQGLIKFNFLKKWCSFPVNALLTGLVC